MKVAIVLCSILALAACGVKDRRRDSPSDFIDLVKKYGYPVEAYDVNTEDGYILTLFRIPHGRQEDRKKSPPPASMYGTYPSLPQQKKGVVFFMHGLMANSETFIYGGPTESIALYLADRGYDVFFGNARGSIYGQRHTTLNPKKDAAFWRFCWDEFGKKDLPAMIDKALSVSGQTKLSYIGHNEGTTSFYVMASEIPEMKNKIERHISLGPIVYLKKCLNEILHTIEVHFEHTSWLIKHLGVNTFAPSSELTHEAESNCIEHTNDEKICKNVYFLINGYNSKHRNQTTLNQLMSRLPSTASVREIIHWVQLKKSGRFGTYSEGSEGKEYDLSKVNIPVALFYTPNDSLSSVSDVETLAKELPKVYMQVNMENLDNNLDLLFSENVHEVAEKVEQALQKNIQGPKVKHTY